jgi:hypothetical protein
MKHLKGIVVEDELHRAFVSRCVLAGKSQAEVLFALVRMVADDTLPLPGPSEWPPSAGGRRGRGRPRKEKKAPLTGGR